MISEAMAKVGREGVITIESNAGVGWSSHATDPIRYELGVAEDDVDFCG